jgi:4-amino-4-deoxy-L-arabinose transferase-like glycosyltransferase
MQRAFLYEAFAARKREESEKRRFLVALGAIAAGALAVRVVYVLAVVRHDTPVGDAQTYTLLARALAHGDGYVRPLALASGVHTPTAEFPPLWPLVLAVPERLGITSPTALRLLGAAIGTATVVLMGLLARRVATPSTGLVAAGLAAVSPFLVSFDSSLQAEGLYALAVTAALLLLAYGLRDGVRLRWWLAAGVALGLAALTRTEALLLVPVVVVPVARAGVDAGHWWQRVGVACLGIVVLVGAWTIRNAVQLHVFQPLTNNSGTLVAGSNCARVYSGYQIGLWRLDCVTDIDTTGLTETEAAARFRSTGVDYARDNASRLPAVVGARVLRTWGAWNPSRQADFESLEGRPKPWINASWVTGWIVAALAIAGAVVQRRAARPVWLLAGPVVVATITAVIAYGNSRFRTVAEPGLLVLAAIALVALARALTTARAPA